MIVKTKSHLVQIRNILKDGDGILFATQLARLDIPRTYLSVLEKNGEIERVARGVYKSPALLEDEMYIFQAVYKSSFYSHETALFLHDLSDRSPLRYSISVPVGYHSAALNGSGHKIFYVNRKLCYLGVVELASSHGNRIRVSNLERTICDVVRSRNQLDVQFVTNALKRYVLMREKNINLLYAYAKSFRVEKLIRQYIEVLL